MAPEVIQQSYNEAADIWSAGIMMYQLLTGGCRCSVVGGCGGGCGGGGSGCGKGTMMYQLLTGVGGCVGRGHRWWGIC